MVELFAYGYIQELRYKYLLSQDLRKTFANQLKKFQDIKNFEISDQSKLLKRIKQKQLDIIFDDEY